MKLLQMSHTGWWRPGGFQNGTRRGATDGARKGRADDRTRVVFDQEREILTDNATSSAGGVSSKRSRRLLGLPARTS